MEYQGARRLCGHDAASRVSVSPKHRWKPTCYEHCVMGGGNVRSSGRSWQEVVAEIVDKYYTRDGDEDGGLLAPRQVGELLKVSARTLGKWRQHNKGPRFIRLGYNKVVYRMEDVLEWVGARSELL